MCFIWKNVYYGHITKVGIAIVSAIFENPDIKQCRSCLIVCRKIQKTSCLCVKSLTERYQNIMLEKLYVLIQIKKDWMSMLPHSIVKPVVCTRRNLSKLK